MTGPVATKLPVRYAEALEKWGGDRWPWRKAGSCWYAVDFWNSTLLLTTSGANAGWLRFERKTGNLEAKLGTPEAENFLNCARSAFGTGKPEHKPKPTDPPLHRRLTLLIGRCMPKYGDVVRVELKEAAELAEGMQQRIDRALEFAREQANALGKTDSERVADLTRLTEILEGVR